MTYISPIQSSHQGVYYPWPKCIWDEAIFKFGWGGEGRKYADRVFTFSQLGQGSCVLS